MKKRLLIADDDDTVRSPLATLLRTQFDVVEARDGAEALRLITRSTEPFHGIVTDGNMPRIDGIGVIKELCRLEIAHDLLVVMYTAGDRDYRRNAVRAGAERVFEKPHDLPMLVEFLQHNLRSTP